jgi:hypothetical protein
MMCYIWLYTSIIVVRGLFDVLRYLLEKRMKKIDSESEYIDNDQLYEHDDEYLHKRQYPIYTR